MIAATAGHRRDAVATARRSVSAELSMIGHMMDPTYASPRTGESVDVIDAALEILHMEEVPDGTSVSTHAVFQVLWTPNSGARSDLGLQFLLVPGEDGCLRIREIRERPAESGRARRTPPRCEPARPLLYSPGAGDRHPPPEARGRVRNRKEDSHLRIRTLFAAGLSAVLLAGCGDDNGGPNQEPPPDFSTPRAALRSLAELYSRQLFTEALSAHAASFRFIPAQPESIPFLEPGETSWDLDRESMILERLLVPERINWLDQVLLEHEITEVVDSTATLTRITTRTDLTILVGEVTLVQSRSFVDYLYEVNPDGKWLLREQRESLYPGSGLTYGQLKTRVESKPGVATLAIDEGTITSTGATLKGRVIPNGLPATYYFEWGPTSAYGARSADADAGSAVTPTVYEFPVTGLPPATEYHYRIVAHSLWGTSRGADLTFTTLP